MSLAASISYGVLKAGFNLFRSRKSRKAAEALRRAQIQQITDRKNNLQTLFNDAKNQGDEEAERFYLEQINNLDNLTTDLNEITDDQFSENFERLDNYTQRAEEYQGQIKQDIEQIEELRDRELEDPSGLSRGLSELETQYRDIERRVEEDKFRRGDNQALGIGTQIQKARDKAGLKSSAFANQTDRIAGLTNVLSNLKSKKFIPEESIYQKGLSLTDRESQTRAGIADQDYSRREGLGANLSRGRQQRIDNYTERQSGNLDQYHSALGEIYGLGARNQARRSSQYAKQASRDIEDVAGKTITGASRLLPYFTK